MKGKRLFIYMCFMIPALYGCGTAASIAGGTALAAVKMPLYLAGAVVGATAEVAGAAAAEASDRD
ncbi:hypothetical protein CC99x_003070 [Candidatus Berkiella cookevillensis]|uniref:Lipoprotein n=1 Tax=Candidatus Berkiella cookevillensis TaxID=437022 RepID=A0A0Q9YDB7_9GAMM|nr:hypothetical protein [Candidatus Berkiella cookevillensis]MCS5707879.1 hypothetical protein [Candidatus Berkiella cookevillensis]